MSLLEAIAARNGERQNMVSQSQQSAAADAGKPDAVATAKSQRKDYGGAIAAAPDQQPQEESATPEEQAMFTEMEKALAETVYGEKASNSIVKAVMGAGDPVEGVGKISADLVTAMARKFPNATDEVLMGIGESAVEQVVDLVEASNPDVNLSDDQIAEAYSIGVSAWMETNPNAVDKDMQAYTNQPAPAQLQPKPAMAAVGGQNV